MPTTQTQIARRAGIHVSMVNKILNRRPDPEIKPAIVRKVFKVAEELGYSPTRPNHAHHRRYERTLIGLKGKLLVYLKDGSVFDSGECVVSDIAACGASLERVVLRKRSLPMELFTVGILMNGVRNADAALEIHGVVVRLIHATKGMRLGIAFQDVGPKLEKTIASLTRSR